MWRLECELIFIVARELPNRIVGSNVTAMADSDGRGGPVDVRNVHLGETILSKRIAIPMDSDFDVRVL
jgi:hypothetical protein